MKVTEVFDILDLVAMRLAMLTIFALGAYTVITKTHSPPVTATAHARDNRREERYAQDPPRECVDAAAIGTQTHRAD